MKEEFLKNLYSHATNYYFSNNVKIRLILITLQNLHSFKARSRVILRSIRLNIIKLELENLLSNFVEILEIKRNFRKYYSK